MEKHLHTSFEYFQLHKQNTAVRSRQARTHVQVVVPAELGRERLRPLLRQSELNPGVQAKFKVLAYILAKKARSRKDRAHVVASISLTLR